MRNGISVLLVVVPRHNDLIAKILAAKDIVQNCFYRKRLADAYLKKKHTITGEKGFYAKQDASDKIDVFLRRIDITVVLIFGARRIWWVKVSAFCFPCIRGGQQTHDSDTIPTNQHIVCSEMFIQINRVHNIHSVFHFVI